MWPLNDPQIVPVGSGLWVQSPPLLCRAIDRPPQTAYRQGARERDEVILAPQITGYRALLEWLTVFKLHQPRLNSGFGGSWISNGRSFMGVRGGLESLRTVTSYFISSVSSVASKRITSMTTSTANDLTPGSAMA